MRGLARLAGLAGAMLVLGATRPPHAAPGLPPIVFVSRAPVPGVPSAIPGLGPRDRAVATGGRLLVREPDGGVRALLPDGALFDVSDPAVSFDGHWIAFSGITHPGSGWRLYLVPSQGGAPRPITVSGQDEAARFDDLDPCWIGDDRLCFASTRDGSLAQYAPVPVTNLFCVGSAGGDLERLTSERNGAEEPAWDPRARRIVYARWWFNHDRAARDSALGITRNLALAIRADSVNLWQAVSITPDGGDLRLAAGAITSRLGTMAYQPAQLADGSWCGVYARNAGLHPAAGGSGIQAFPGRYGVALRLAGPVISESAGDPYAQALGLAVPSACSPAGLPDGRVLFAYDPGGRGDFGIWVMDAGGSHLERVIDRAGTLELDPAPLLPLAERVPGLARAASARASQPAPRMDAAGATFTYDCRNVFAQGPVDSPVPDGLRLASDLVLRVFAVRPRTGAAQDSAVLIREVAVASDGSARVPDLPADTPLFEQIVDARRSVMMTAHGPAHVAGLNWARPGSTARCLGCHLGHSILASESERDRDQDAWFNASPSADVRASGARAGTAGAKAAVDRRARGALAQVAWIADGSIATLTLDWNRPLEIRELVLHAARPERGPGARLGRCEVRLRNAGAPAGRWTIESPDPGTARVALGGAIATQVEVTLTTRDRRGVATLAEIETLARLPARVP